MKMKYLEQEALDELEEEKNSLAKEVIKERIIEIQKVEKLLIKLKSQYQKILKQSVSKVTKGIENGNIRF